MPRRAAEPRDCRFVVMLTDPERRALRASATREGITESELIRRRTFATATESEEVNEPVVMTVAMDVHTARRVMRGAINPKDH
jgi:hypothetical protein